jgi:hypothetical protein
MPHHAGRDIVAERVEGFEVLARAEAAPGAGQHQRAQLEIRSGLANCGRERAEQVGRHRIQRLRLVKRQHTDVALAIALYAWHLDPPGFLRRPR